MMTRLRLGPALLLLAACTTPSGLPEKPVFNWYAETEWSATPPSGAQPPIDCIPFGDLPTEEGPTTCGSVIDTQNQILGESLPIVGTPYRLHYSSGRVRGYRGPYRRLVNLTLGALPPGLKRVRLQAEVAGRSFSQEFPAQIDQNTTFVWDGNDAMGSPLTGSRPLTLRLGYVYDAVVGVGQRFNLNSEPVTVDPVTSELTMWREWFVSIGTQVPQGLDLGGWDLDVHHSYDPAGQTLLLGDGNLRRARPLAPAIATVAGNGLGGFWGDGGLAKNARLNNPTGLALAADGTLYFSDSGNRRVRRVSVSGIISTFAGTGGFGSTGDGGPAVAAQLASPTDIALGPDGSLYILDTAARRVRKVSPGGIISTVAGGGADPSDGVVATSADLIGPRGIAVGSDGSLYLTDSEIGLTTLRSCRLRKVDPGGIITTVAGQFGADCGYAGDGGPASAALLSVAWDVAAATDGTLYISDTGNLRVRKIALDGTISTVAGDGQIGGSPARCVATQGRFYLNRGLSLGPDGALYVADTGNNQVRRVGQDGIMTTVAGNQEEFLLNDGGRATQAQLRSPGRVAVGADGAVYLSDAGWQRVRRVNAPWIGYGDELRLAAGDGSEVYIFSQEGRHLRTVDALTGVVRLVFGYDGAGRLVTVTDLDGRTTTIQRDGGGAPAAIVAPAGQNTALLLGGGQLARVTNPAGEAVQLGHGSGGLLTSLTDARGGVHQYTYDGEGRLTRDADPAGGFKELVRVEQPFGDKTQSWTVTVTTAAGRTSSYEVTRDPHQLAQTSNQTLPGEGTRSEQRNYLNRTAVMPDGVTFTRERQGAPRFYDEAPLDKTVRLSQAGLVTTRTQTRTVTLSDPREPLGLATQTDQVDINGRVYTQSYTAATRTMLLKTPLNRQTTVVLNNKGRPETMLLAGLLPEQLSYDGQGRLSQWAQGTRRLTLTYDAAGNLGSVTDALGRVVSYGYDLAGRLVQQTMPDGRVVIFGRDAHGNLTSLAPPGRGAHGQGFTAVDLMQSYTPPDLDGGVVATQYSYNLDRQLTQIARPDGQNIGFGYNGNGQLVTMSTPGGDVTLTYDASGRVTSVADPGGVTVQQGYGGIFQSSETYSGAVSGSVGWSYDSDLRLAAEQVGGGSVIFGYDDDGLMTDGGNGLGMSYLPQNGLLSWSLQGVVGDELDYGGHGEVTRYEAKVVPARVAKGEFERFVPG